MTIAGSDSSGGAGIQADLKTFAALGVYGASVITALTAQNTQGVSGIHPVPAPFIARQFTAVTTDLDVKAIKIGMLGTADAVEIIADCLENTDIQTIVLDPVMVATSGDKLLDDEAIDVIKTHLFPRATLITPNRAEASKLTGSHPYETIEQMDGQARRILQMDANAVLLKGGHTTSKTALDLLVTGSGSFPFERPKIATSNTHGTGCTLSSAITAHLAMDLSLKEAVESAKEYVWQALQAARTHKIGQGNGPLDHAFALRLKNDHEQN